MVRDNFAIFILTHGRADNVVTLKTLKSCGYTGKYYLIVDNEDSQQQKYLDNFGTDHVIIFDKLTKSRVTDTCDLQKKRNIVVFARNSCHEIAKQLGLTYFLELDDDYIEFRQRYEKDGTLSSRFVLDFDSCVEATLDYLDESHATSIAWAQMGDFIGGLGCSMYRDRVTRKVMNSFFCRVDKPFEFYGRINEDVNAYVTLGSRGVLFLTVADIALNQIDTQQNKGGLTDSYLDNGTYIKSFYTVMMNPSSVKIASMGVTHIRFHHSVNWECAVPKIISSKFRQG